jgi:hypothetical protein
VRTGFISVAWATGASLSRVNLNRNSGMLEKEKGTNGFQVRILEADVEKPKVFVLLKFGRHDVARYWRAGGLLDRRSLPWNRLFSSEI